MVKTSIIRLWGFTYYCSPAEECCLLLWFHRCHLLWYQTQLKKKKRDITCFFWLSARIRRVLVHVGQTAPPLPDNLFSIPSFQVSFKSLSITFQ